MDSYICCHCGCPYNHYYNINHASRKSCRLSNSGYHFFKNKYLIYIKEFFTKFCKKISNLF